MEDTAITELFFKRDQTAIGELWKKYGKRAEAVAKKHVVRRARRGRVLQRRASGGLAQDPAGAAGVPRCIFIEDRQKYRGQPSAQ